MPKNPERPPVGRGAEEAERARLESRHAAWAEVSAAEDTEWKLLDQMQVLMDTPAEAWSAAHEERYVALCAGLRSARERTDAALAKADVLPAETDG